MEDYKLSQELISECSIPQLLKINEYLLDRHKYHFKYENYDKLEPLANFMDEIENIILYRLVNGEIEITFSEYSQNNEM